VNAVSQALGVTTRPVVTPDWLLSVLGLFSRSTRGLLEMLPQWREPYLVDDRDYCERFGAQARSLEDGVAQLTAA
jgi:hypothetical protein